MTRRFVAVGAGQTAAVAARTLRRRGFDGEIVLVGAEVHPPYQRPPLSKGILLGTTTADDLAILTPEWCADNSVELRTGIRVERLVTASRSLELSDGSSITADIVLFATGGRPRTLPGVSSERVLYLRTLDDALRLRTGLSSGKRIVTVGGGFVGAEVAASASVCGANVTMLEKLDAPLVRTLGAEMGAVCAEIHREHGVDLRTREVVETVRETGDGVQVRTSAGMVYEADLVVVGVGMVPNSEVAAAAGITVDNGILVDECCRTNVDGVLAAGDVANHRHPVFGRRLRVEHFDNANKQGAAAARTALGTPKPYDDVHWFWSDQYEYNLQYAGHAPEWSDVVVRGSIVERSFCAFYLLGGIVQAAFAVDRGEDISYAKEFIANRAAPDPAKLRDEEIDLDELVSWS